MTRADLDPSTVIVIDSNLPAHESSAQYAAAMPCMEAALQAFRTADKFDGAQLDLMDQWAALHQKHGNRDLARPLFEEALAISRRVFGADHSNTLTALCSLAGFHRAVDDHAATLPLLLEIVEICRRTKPQDDEDHICNLTALVDIYLKNEQVELALPFSRELLQATRRRYGNDDRRTLHEAAEVGSLLVHLNQPIEGGRLILEAVKGITILQGKHHPDVMNLVETLLDLFPLMDTPQGVEDFEDSKVSLTFDTPQFGLMLQPTNGGLISVVGIAAGSAAEGSGLRKGDILTSVAGTSTNGLDVDGLTKITGWDSRPVVLVFSSSDIRAHLMTYM